MTSSHCCVVKPSGVHGEGDTATPFLSVGTTPRHPASQLASPSANPQVGHQNAPYLRTYWSTCAAGEDSARTAGRPEELNTELVLDLKAADSSAPEMRNPHHTNLLAGPRN